MCSGYALLTVCRMVAAGGLGSDVELLKSRGISMMRWMIEQRTARGGFVSTQDTVLALQALSEFALLFSPSTSLSAASMETGLLLTFEWAASPSGPAAISRTIRLDPSRPTVLQRLELVSPFADAAEQTADGPLFAPSATAASELRVKCSGPGFAVVQIGWTFNVISSSDSVAEPAEDGWELALEVQSNALDAAAEQILVSSCAKWLQTADSANRLNRSGSADSQRKPSGMVVSETWLPSGYLLASSQEELAAQHRTAANGNESPLKMTESDGKHVALYFDQVALLSSSFSTRIF